MADRADDMVGIYLGSQSAFTQLCVGDRDRARTLFYRTKGAEMKTDWIGQINAQQARATIIRMALVGAISALGVLSQHLDSIVATTSPLGMALAFGIGQALYYLRQGDEPPKDE
jgi:hypothetical protein